MDDYRIDSHKLIYHVERVAKWLQGEDIYPIYIEISPYGGCNHRCIFCAFDYLEYRPNYLNTSFLKKFLKDISLKGVKSIMFSGEGEPLLHKDIAELIVYAKDTGLDVAVTTNGVLLKEMILEKILPHLSWLRISLDAGTPSDYASIHRTEPKDFDVVIKNIKEAVRIKKRKGYLCTVGVQSILLNENHKSIYKLVEILKDLGVDYLIVKPYSQHPQSCNRLGRKIDYERFLSLQEEFKKYEEKSFKIIFRRNAMMKIGEKKPYKGCLGLPFWAYLSSNGDLYACSTFLGNKVFSYGNIYQESFEEIWKAKKRKKIMGMLEGKTTDICRQVCRLDEINRYLWELKNPPLHVNFI